MWIYLNGISSMVRKCICWKLFHIKFDAKDEEDPQNVATINEAKERCTQLDYVCVSLHQSKVYQKCCKI